MNYVDFMKKAHALAEKFVVRATCARRKAADTSTGPLWRHRGLLPLMVAGLHRCQDMSAQWCATLRKNHREVAREEFQKARQPHGTPHGFGKTLLTNIKNEDFEPSKTFLH